MYDRIIETAHTHYTALLEQHRLNIQIMLSNPRSIPEHISFMESLDKELEALAAVKDKLDALELL